MSKLKINTITYQRVKNLGNYETERLEVSISIDEVNDAKHLIQIDEEWDELY